MSKTKLAFMMLPALLVLAGYLAYRPSLPTCERPIASMRASLKKGTSVSMKGFRFIDQDLNSMKMSVRAEKVNLCNMKYHYFRIATGQVMELVKPDFMINGTNGTSTEITGESAMIDPLRKEVVFSDGAEVKNRGGTLKSENIVWNYKKGFVRAEGGYSISSSGNMSAGDNICVNLQDMTIFNRI